MAEINIQRNQSSAVWWVIGLIALAVILWAIFDWSSDTEVTSLADSPVPIALAVPSIAPTA